MVTQTKTKGRANRLMTNTAMSCVQIILPKKIITHNKYDLLSFSFTETTVYNWIYCSVEKETVLPVLSKWHFQEENLQVLHCT